MSTSSSPVARMATLGRPCTATSAPPDGRGHRYGGVMDAAGYLAPPFTSPRPRLRSRALLHFPPAATARFRRDPGVACPTGVLDHHHGVSALVGNRSPGLNLDRLALADFDRALLQGSARAQLGPCNAGERARCWCRRHAPQNRRAWSGGNGGKSRSARKSSASTKPTALQQRQHFRAAWARGQKRIARAMLRAWEKVGSEGLAWLGITRCVLTGISLKQAKKRKEGRKPSRKSRGGMFPPLADYG